MVLATIPKHSNKQGKIRYTTRKYNNLCLKQLRILVKITIGKHNKTNQKKHTYIK